MSDGTLLAFVGLERTGGIMTFDVSTPAKSKFQDLLNVRNWRTTAEDMDRFADEITYNLNDGPEHLVFIPASESPTGAELLLAATPLAARLTVYDVEYGFPRRDDGSCVSTRGCPYIPKQDGGTGQALGLTFCDVCATREICV